MTAGHFCNQPGSISKKTRMAPSEEVTEGAEVASRDGRLGIRDTLIGIERY